MCKLTSTSIAADGQAVATALNSIAVELAKTNPTLAANLKTAATALVTATANWQTGTPTADIETAATAIEALLNAIPQTAAYAPFVAIAVAALDIILANIGTQSVQTGDKVANALKVTDHVETVLPPNAWRGEYKIQGFRAHFENPRAAFAQAWNKQTDKQPEFNFPKL
jgi:hypothetical protein